MPMHNLLEYTDNYSITTGSFWNSYGHEINDSAAEINNGDRINNNKIIKSKSFEYKRKIIGKTS